ncbi:MAG: citrate synthase [Elusimicrobia bacterium]|nr:citrate synthase [Candidatus Obscuribacterium magneticum]
MKKSDVDLKSVPENYKPGLDGVIAGLSDISEIDPDRDSLSFRGYEAHVLAEQASYMEVAYLLLYGKLPNRAELESFNNEMAQERNPSPQMVSFLKHLPPGGNVMTGLAIAIAYASMYDPDCGKNDRASNLAKAKRLIAQSPTLVAALYRLGHAQKIIHPDPKLGHAANFLYMLTGKETDPEIAHCFESTLVLYAEHGYNASTFTALVTASTLSDMYAAVVSAIGALKGPLHGGANEGAIETLLNVGDVTNVDFWLKGALERKEKIMGFGHRVYKKQDSRAPLQKQMAERISRRLGDTKLYPLAVKLEEAMKREKNLFPNVDYYSAVLYYLVGLPIEVYTPIFAMSRMAGWTAHIMEQHAANRLIRPDCHYVGEKSKKFVPLDER